MPFVYIPEGEDANSDYDDYDDYEDYTDYNVYTDATRESVNSVSSIVSTGEIKSIQTPVIINSGNEKLDTPMYPINKKIKINQNATEQDKEKFLAYLDKEIEIDRNYRRPRCIQLVMCTNKIMELSYPLTNSVIRTYIGSEYHFVKEQNGSGIMILSPTAMFDNKKLNRLATNMVYNQLIFGNVIFIA